MRIASPPPSRPPNHHLASHFHPAVSCLRNILSSLSPTCRRYHARLGDSFHRDVARRRQAVSSRCILEGCGFPAMLSRCDHVGPRRGVSCKPRRHWAWPLRADKQQQATLLHSCSGFSRARNIFGPSSQLETLIAGVGVVSADRPGVFAACGLLPQHPNMSSREDSVS